MTNRLKILLILLGIVICYVGIKGYIDSIKYKMEIDIAEKEILIYQSIANNTNFINQLINK